LPDCFIGQGWLSIGFHKGRRNARDYLKKSEFTSINTNRLVPDVQNNLYRVIKVIIS
jgi:hypothetical protein